jgi:hypothetical protein
MRRSIRQIRIERPFLPLLARLSMFKEPEHALRKVLGRVEPLSRDIRDILVRDLVGAFGIKGRKHLDGRGPVF